MPETATAIARRVVLDLDRCIECRACMAACYYGHCGRAGLGLADIGPAVLPVVCRQCADPACVQACPADAMKRDERGVVSRGIFQCRGCLSCARACPFGMLSLEMAGLHVAKCDLCEDRVVKGLEPVCASVCPTGALRFATAAEIEAQGLVVLGGRIAGDHPIKRR